MAHIKIKTGMEVRLSKHIINTIRRFSVTSEMVKMVGTVQKVESVRLEENKIYLSNYVWDIRDVKPVAKPLPIPKPELFDVNQLIIN